MTTEVMTPITHEEATIALTMIDAGLRSFGLKVADMPGGLSAVQALCEKLSAMQDPLKIQRGK